MYDKPPGWDVKKISDKTHKKLTKVWKHRETGGWKSKAGQDYRKYLKNLKKITPTKLGHQLKGITPEKMMKNSKSFYFKATPKPSTFLQRRVTLGGAKSLTTALKTIGKRTGIGKAVAAATVVAGAYEAGKRKLFTKDKKKKTIDKKSIGGETVVMKSGGGYIDELL